MPDSREQGAGFTPGPWTASHGGPRSHQWTVWADGGVMGDQRVALMPYELIAQCGNARLIAAAPDHAFICWAMCVQDGRWEEWVPFDGSGEFVFAGLRYATKLDEFGCPKLTPALREAISKSQSTPTTEAP